jgi:NAD(P)H-hydrate repair Nnr-like enzyme with NAD(P)H-hydrate epimerase domain
MQRPDDPRSQWVRKEAAKHTTPASIRQRIADEQNQIRILVDAGLGSGPTTKALEAHHELIRLITERLAKLSSS